MAKGTMITTRSFWIHFTCVFAEQPDDKTLNEKKKKMQKYVKNYLNDLAKSKHGKGMKEVKYWDEKNLRWVPEGATSSTSGSKGMGTAKLVIDYGSPWSNYLKEEWNFSYQGDTVVYTYIAYFIDDNNMRVCSPTENKGTMNPPPPPPPPAEM